VKVAPKLEPVKPTLVARRDLKSFRGSY